MNYDLSTPELLEDFKINYPTDWQVFEIACKIAEEISANSFIANQFISVNDVLRLILHKNSNTLRDFVRASADNEKLLEAAQLKANKTKKDLESCWTNLVEMLTDGDIDVSSDDIKTIIEGCHVPDYLLPKKEIELWVKVFVEIPKFVDISDYRYNIDQFVEDFKIDLYSGDFEINE